jgi:hypothetical protein
MKPIRKKLLLTRETLRQLDPFDLSKVGGMAPSPPGSSILTPTIFCPTQLCPGTSWPIPSTTEYPTKPTPACP